MLMDYWNAIAAMTSKNIAHIGCLKVLCSFGVILTYAHKHPLPFLSCAADMRVIMKTTGYPDSGALFIKLLGACKCCLLQIQHTEAIQVSRVQSGSPAHIAADAAG